ncbi:fungal specific transcription factor domain-containing protein [Sarocladium implicatum]|nr:fungal specific transcription factor domain-containing protein [Sarocladium implicatum]
MQQAGFKYIAQLEERLSEVVGLLQDKTPKEPERFDGELHLEEVATSFSLDLDRSSLPSLNEKALPAENMQIALVDDMINPWDPFGDESAIYSLDSLPLPHVDRSLDPPAFTSDSSLHLRPTAFKQYQKMPTRTMAAELVHTTFTLYNRFVPLFDEENFRTEFNLKFPISEFADPGWWACLNVVLSIAHRLRSLSTLDPTEHNNLASGYLQNALSVVTELSVSTRSLSAVQALTGMACILQGTADSEPAAMLTAASLRLAQAMNLHRECINSNLTQREAEIRRRVFWKTYILDKDISMRTGRPFSQDDEEMDVQLPSSTNHEPWSMDGFRHRVGLAVIQGQVYKQLYSIRAEKQTQAERAKAAESLASLLSYWKSGADLEPEENFTELLGGQLEGDMLHKVVLRLTYLHCLSMIDRHLPPTAALPSNQMPEDSDAFVSSGNLYLTESREAFHLFKSIPHGDRSCVW